MNKHEVIVVTRHKGLVDWLKKHHHLNDCEYKVISHATEDDVKGKDIIGILPLNLAALANSITTVDLDLPLEMRGKELTAEDVEKYFLACSTYYVTCLDSVRKLKEGEYSDVRPSL